ncbi:hypothetical protein C1646_770086 [Rhizophagus diaphanus]|nr:hypothetical protein C1646_770086 [Rhizophagus diaphanus] [Rhizophagus sp. MUCL 43196]
MVKACKYVFKMPYVVNTDYNDYIILRKILEEAIVALLKVFGTVFSKLPNIHVLWHLPDIAANFGTLINTSILIKEADNILQTLRYLLDSRLDKRYNKIDLFAKIIYDKRLHNLLDNWYISDIVKDNTAESCSGQMLHKFPKAAFPFLEKTFFNGSIRFTVKNEDVYSNITLRIGEAIDVENVDDPNGCLYAFIRAIMIYQNDFRQNNPFLLIDWFYEKGSADSVMGFLIYGLQESDDHSWFHLYPLIIVD